MHGFARKNSTALDYYQVTYSDLRSVLDMSPQTQKNTLNYSHTLYDVSLISNERIFKDYLSFFQQRWKYGCTVTEAAISQYLGLDNHIVGPMDPENVDRIAIYAGNTNVLRDSKPYKDVTVQARSLKRYILTRIDRAVGDKEALHE